MATAQRMRIDERRRTIRTESGGGVFLFLFGSAFAGLGGWAVYLLLTGGEVTVNGRPGTPADVWLPGVFVLFGVAIALGRYRQEVDLRNRTRRASLRLILPVWSREDKLLSPERVTLSRESRGGENRRTVYPVRLVSGAARVEVCAYGHELAARRDAEAIARLVDRPLHDTTAGTELVRAPADLDRSVLETEEAGDRPAPPASSALDVTEGVRGVQIRVPPATVPLVAGAAGLLLMSVPVLLFWLLGWRNAIENPQGPAESLFAYAPLLMILLPLVGAVSAATRGGLFGTRLEVARGEIAVRHLLGATRIAATDVEELREVGSGLTRCVMVRSDARALRCGFGLGDADREYLRASILHYLHRG